MTLAHAGRYIHAAVVKGSQKHLTQYAAHTRLTYLRFGDFNIESIQAVLDLGDFHQREGELEG